METLEAYLDRKEQELSLLNSFLASPLAIRRPASAVDVIKHKFQLAAAMKAEQALHDWSLTETAWADPARRHAGPFRFRYDYQRADLDVRGPSFYDIDDLQPIDTIYTSSGMAAISALLLASAQTMRAADIFALPGAYGETIELIEGYARHLRLVPLQQSAPHQFATHAPRPRILLFDSSTNATAFEDTLACQKPEFDLVVFDTTCFSCGSGRIRRVLSWARHWQLPIVLVRSHTKLDSLGVEYGRLGSAVFVAGAEAKQDHMKRLVTDMRNAVRLLGGAALPAHFPPFIGTRAYRVLTSQRVAAILRNGRRTARYFARALPTSLAEFHFAHGLYLTLAPKRSLDEQQARQLAADLSRELGEAGLPLRHAGSFGFDFGAAEWFHDRSHDRYAIRIAVPDLPTALWDEVAHAAARWWSAHEGPGFRTRGFAANPSTSAGYSLQGSS